MAVFSPAEMSAVLVDAGSIDPFRQLVDGVYDDGVVTVRRVSGPGAARLGLHRVGDRLVLQHCLTDDDLDNDLTGRLAPLLTADAAAFERLFTGVVLTTGADPVAAWTRYYQNTLERLTGPDPGDGSIGEFAPIYRRARSLVRGDRVLDVGSCFGFLPMLVAEDGHDVLACDVNPGSVRLLSTVDARLTGRLTGRLRCVRCAAQNLPFPDAAFDTVLALHLLEHVNAAAGSQVVAEAVRVARLRVVIAVPYEDEPAAAYGHVRTLDHDALDALGGRTELRFEVLDSDGGWLVIDR